MARRDPGAKAGRSAKQSAAKTHLAAKTPGREAVRAIDRGRMHTDQPRPSVVGKRKPPGASKSGA